MSDAGGEPTRAALALRIELTLGTLALRVQLDTRSGPLVIVGPNGAGKTTLLLSVLGAHRPESGVIELAGRQLFDSAAGVNLPVEARGIGYVPADYALFPHLTVAENVDFALPRGPDAAAQLTAQLQELSLSELRERRISQLSGGQQQRVALARALAARPRALLLDEPLAALDRVSRREVRTFLREYLTKLALPCLVVTHDPADARALGMRVAVLEAGCITQLGTWDELVRAPASPFVAELVRLG